MADKTKRAPAAAEKGASKGKSERAAKRKRKPLSVEENGVHVRIFKRGARYWLDVRDGAERKRIPAQTTDRVQAEANAKALATEIAKRQLLGVTPDTLTIGQLFAAYNEHKGRTLEGQWKKAIERRQSAFLSTWGQSLPVVAISQSSVDTYSDARRAAHADHQRKRHAAALVALQKAAAKRGRPTGAQPAFVPQALRDGALDPDFRWLSSVFNWGTRHKLPDGRRLLGLNPLKDCKWPREKKENIRRPVASQDRYERTIAQAKAIDPAGRFRLMLVLARHTARRINAILSLRASDFLLSTARVRGALAEAGHDERLAEHMKYGAIRWRKEFDKQGVDRITPISQTVRAEIDRYLEANPRVGEVPAFPSGASTSEGVEGGITRNTATKWLRDAEVRAELPKLRGGLWHSYRRLWATERKTLPDVDVAEAGGWTGTKAMKLAYQHATPAGVLAAVMGGQSVG